MHRPCLTGIYTIPVMPCNSRRKSPHIFSLALLTKHLLLHNLPSSKQVTYIPRYTLRPLPLLAPHCCFTHIPLATYVWLQPTCSTCFVATLLAASCNNLLLVLQHNSSTRHPLLYVFHCNTIPPALRILLQHTSQPLAMFYTKICIAMPNTTFIQR